MSNAYTRPAAAREDGVPLDAIDLAHLRVDQNGSLVAPERLRTAFDRHARGTCGDEELRAVQDAAIREVVRKQESVGLPVVTDGEFRRRNFQESFSAAVTGFDVPERAERLTGWKEPNKPLHRTEQKFDAPGPAITTRRGAVSRLRLERNVVLEEYRFTAGVARNAVKVSLIGPDRIAQRFAWERSQAVYKDIDEFVADVVAIQRKMIAELVAAGCRYIHMDAPGFTAYVDQVSLDRMRARGEDPDKNLERGIKAENDVIAGFEGVTFGLHICRGNPRGVDSATGKVLPQWHREGHYDAIAERLFTGLKHHRLLLEYDSERAGDFAPLRFMPKDKIAVLGLVTTKVEEVETVDALRRRIDDAARYLPVEQMALSPQCGFSSGVGAVQLSEDAQWRKFERIVETARAVWNSR
jgi:5-methyltetrahydropteroyltriglutamate--homocysteine methyltransferase